MGACKIGYLKKSEIRITLRSQAVRVRLGACWQHREQLTITKTASGFGSCGIVARRMAEVGVSSCQVDGLGCDRGAQLKAGR